MIATWTCNLCTLTGCLMEKNDKVGFDMTYSYGFKDLSVHITRFHSQSRTGWGAYSRDKIPLQELWLKVGGGGLYARGGVFAGHYGN